MGTGTYDPSKFGRDGNGVDKATDAAASAASAASETAHGLMDRAREAIHAAKDKAVEVKDKAVEVKDRAVEVKDRAVERAGEVGTAGMKMSRESLASIDKMIADHPYRAIGLALGFGWLAGRLLKR